MLVGIVPVGIAPVGIGTCTQLIHHHNVDYCLLTQESTAQLICCDHADDDADDVTVARDVCEAW